MKKMLLAVILFPAATVMADAVWAETIPAQDTPDYYGQSVTVVGRASVQKMGSGEIYLDLEGSGDGAPVSAYISRWNAGRFWDIADLDGKMVAVSGDIGSFRYRPEIFLTDPGQITMVNPPVTREESREPRPLWIHIGLKQGDLKQMQHGQNHHRP